MERRLAAIMAADVVGYSRLIRADEEGTIAALKALRADLIDPRIAAHNGRIVKLMGDGMLAEFASVVDAVRAAVETQVAVAEHNAGLPENKRIEFRVGINLGDVIIDGDDIQGDGVNVAARLETMSEPGGLCISDVVYQSIRGKTGFAFADLGQQQLKNIDTPIRVWRWSAHGDGIEAIAGVGSEPLPLPEKPSIAVLPFDYLGGGSEYEVIADGMTEDIITALSKIAGLLVGKAIPGYQAGIVDENGAPLPPGEQGWLAVKGPTGCRYLDNEERQRAYVKQGWNVTGDIYRMDDDGYFWYVARGDDMIISSGYNISGPEVESCG